MKINFTWSGAIFIDAENKEEAQEIFNEMSWEEVLRLAMCTNDGIYEDIEIMED